MKLTFERKLPIILFFVFLMLTATGLLFYQRTDSLQQALSRQQHSQEVVSTLDDALAMAVASESEQRGFIVTGNTTYLDRFERRKRLVNDDLARLRALAADSPPHILPPLQGSRKRSLIFGRSPNPRSRVENRVGTRPGSKKRHCSARRRDSKRCVFRSRE
jgi:hypothetical protein